MTFGVRTFAGGSAVEGSDYEPFKETITMKTRELERTIDINIVDNNEWEPDMDFWVELYDLDTLKRLSGDDTKTVITILDEDFPGTIGFEMTGIRVDKK